MESLNDDISQISGIRVWETVPDTVFEEANEIGLVDLPPDELLNRLKDGKVYIPQQAREAIRHFIREVWQVSERILVCIGPNALTERLVRTGIRVAMRHSVQNPEQGRSAVFTSGALQVDLLKRQITVGDRDIHLTPIQYRLLSVLVKNAGKV
jgi:hypothetical protein